MRKILFAAALLLLFVMNVSAQDTLVANGKHYHFIPGMTDTIKNNGGNYIVKYVYEPEEAYGMRSEGKIYVVVMVLATIFAGIFVYLVMLDRKIKRTEKEEK